MAVVVLVVFKEGTRCEIVFGLFESTQKRRVVITNKAKKAPIRSTQKQVGNAPNERKKSKVKDPKKTVTK